MEEGVLEGVGKGKEGAEHGFFKVIRDVVRVVLALVRYFRYLFKTQTLRAAVSFDVYFFTSSSCLLFSATVLYCASFVEAS